MSTLVFMMTLDLDDCLPSVLISVRFSMSCFIESSCHASIMMIYCFLSYNFTTNINHLKEKMISIIVEIPCFFFLVGLFPHMGFFPISLVLFHIKENLYFHAQVHLIQGIELRPQFFFYSKDQNLLNLPFFLDMAATA